ncbi:MAG: exonuclease domain-containing protein [Hyphomicrobiales bacterium]
MLENWSLRRRVFLFFALIGLGSAVVIGAAMWLAAMRIGVSGTRHLVLFGGLAIFTIIGLVFWVWRLFDDNMSRPIETIVAEFRSTLHAGGSPGLTETHARYLGGLGAVVREASEVLVRARNAVKVEVERATEEAERQKNRLEAVLRDLDQGVVICTLDHKTLLYNRKALQILHVSGDLGLGRSLVGVISAQPIRHALERLIHRFESEAYTNHPEGLSTLMVCATCDGRSTLQGRISLVLDAAATKPAGYVATFDDVTQTLALHAKRDRLLRVASEDLRRPVANLRAATEMLTADAELDTDARAAFEAVLQSEVIDLSERLDRLETDSREILSGAWPMSDVASVSLFNCVIRRDSERRNLTVEIAGEPVWVHCDSLTIVEVVDRMINRISQKTGLRAFTLEATRANRKVYLDVHWKGAAVSMNEISGWLSEPLDASLGGLGGDDVLDRHNTEFWCESSLSGGARLRLPLAPPVLQHAHVTTESVRRPSERPEFYDFDLLEQVDPAAIDDTPLRSATYVVFDTETTGLEPSRGDEIVSIAGVRIVNGRVLRGEIFDQLVNPGRAIPKLSSKVHGITNEMVADAPAISEVLPRFQAFSRDAVLVAHNAAFDMRFLTLKQELCGVHFDNPVLDTVLLGAQLYGTAESLSLDSLIARFGIEITEEDRHTALGDTLATAELFLRFLDMLEAAGIQTLHDAVDASQNIVAIRRQQARY